MNTLAVPGFVQEVRTYGRFDVDGCLNCDSCTVVCDLAGDHASFPRKPMQQALLGLKSSLVRSLDPWLCHDCGDCAATCPRQTEPRESMMTLRRYLAARYDFTGIASRIYRSAAWEIGAMAAVFLVVVALVVVYHLTYVEMAMDDLVSTSMGLEHMFPTITYYTIVVFLLPLSILLVNGFRMYRFTTVQPGEERPRARFYVAEAKTVFFHLLTHRNLKRCGDDGRTRRWIKHWLLGTACLTMCVIPLFFLQWFQTDAVYPLSHPQRWLGYAATVVMIAVPLDILIRRLKKGGEPHRFSEPGDILFPLMLLLVAVSGIAVNIFRYAEFSMACHYAYAVHLAITTSLLLVELPFGKWSHVLYRPLALYFQAVKERAMAGSEAGAEAVLPAATVLKGTQPT